MRFLPFVMFALPATFAFSCAQQNLDRGYATGFWFLGVFGFIASAIYVDISEG